MRLLARRTNWLLIFLSLILVPVTGYAAWYFEINGTVQSLSGADPAGISGTRVAACWRFDDPPAVEYTSSLETPPYWATWFLAEASSLYFSAPSSSPGNVLLRSTNAPGRCTVYDIQFCGGSIWGGGSVDDPDQVFCTTRISKGGDEYEAKIRLYYPCTYFDTLGELVSSPGELRTISDFFLATGEIVLRSSSPVRYKVEIQDAAFRRKCDHQTVLGVLPGVIFPLLLE